MINQFNTIVCLFLVLLSSYCIAEEGPLPDGCTTVTVGKKASFDGSVINSHTLDGHRYRTSIDIQPARDYTKDATRVIRKRVTCDTFAMITYEHIPVSKIPQVSRTYGYINSAMRCMNDQQLTLGESTFTGRSSLKSENGLIMVEQLTELILERCSTAREAIRFTGQLLKEYGWIDVGEVLTISDPREVWHLEIVGPGWGNKGAIWAAQRVPDDHVSVCANASRITEIDLTKPDYFLASENVFKVARDSGWWNPEKGPFRFCYAYHPEGRRKMSSRRREWRVFDLLAPSQNFSPVAETYPFSIKPDSAVTLEKMVRIFQDYYENTPFNPIKNITWVNDDDVTEISPLANPFMPYDLNRTLRINGGWGWRGERTIARWYTIYAIITQSREWLPNPVGGVVWLAWDNVASSIYIPIYCGNTDVPPSYKIRGRHSGYSRECAWWVFNRLGTLTAQRWGDMRKDVRGTWDPLQSELFSRQEQLEKEAVLLYREDPRKAKEFLTDYSLKWGQHVIDEALDLGDWLWTKYDEKF